MTTERVMLLIDADNVSLDVMEQAVRLVLQQHGALHVRRAYCTAESAMKHQAVFKHLGIKPMVNLAAGKNSTDIAMAVDAIDLVLAERPDVVVIASSDSDFAPLVQRLREKGCVVRGIGQSGKTGDETKDVYDDYTVLEHRPAAARRARSGDGTAADGGGERPAARRGSRKTAAPAKKAAASGGRAAPARKRAAAAKTAAAADDGDGADSATTGDAGAEGVAPARAASDDAPAAPARKKPARKTAAKTPAAKRPAAGRRAKAAPGSAPKRGAAAVSEKPAPAPAVAAPDDEPDRGRGHDQDSDRDREDDRDAARPSRAGGDAGRSDASRDSDAGPDGEAGRDDEASRDRDTGRGSGSGGGGGGGGGGGRNTGGGRGAGNTGRGGGGGRGNDGGGGGSSGGVSSGGSNQAGTGNGPAGGTARATSLQAVLDCLPELERGKGLALNVAVQRLREARLLGRNTSSLRLFSQWADRFELLPADKPSQVRLRAI